jgi:hypothetical protein
MYPAILVLALLLPGPQPAPPRDRPADGQGTGAIRGKVVSAATREPLHRVRITLNTANPDPPTAVTDARGEFELTAVPVGSYTLQAARVGYLTTFYGQRRPGETGRRIAVSKGETVEGIEMSLPRGGVLAGTVTDESGEAYPEIRVEAVEYRYLRGRRLPVQAASTRTDDLGQFRLSGLQPGTYMLRASSTDIWDGDDGATTHAYAPTYFPGVTGFEQAQTISVAAGQEIGNLAFALRPGRTARIIGVLQDAAGDALPARAVSVSLFIRGVNGAPSLLGGPGSSTTRTDASGGFTFSNLAPGEYGVSFEDAGQPARMIVGIGDGETRSIVLTPQTPAVLRGTIGTDDRSPLPFPAARLRVTPVATDPESLFPSFWAPGAASVAGDGSFRINNIAGQYLLRVTGLPDDWMLAAVNVGGRNTTDAPLTIAAGTEATAHIVLTRTMAKVDGAVATASGDPAPDSTVLIFADDPSRWTIASRFVRVTRPDRSGRFSAGGLPAGIYRAIAREYVAEGQWEDPDFLRSLLPDATRFELAADRTTTLKLSVGVQP